MLKDVCEIIERVIDNGVWSSKEDNRLKNECDDRTQEDRTTTVEEARIYRAGGRVKLTHRERSFSVAPEPFGLWCVTESIVMTSHRHDEDLGE